MSDPRVRCYSIGQTPSTGSSSSEARLQRPGGGGFGPSAPPDVWHTVAEFTYDALGRRIRATCSDAPGVDIQDVLYYYDGQCVLAEFDHEEGTAEQWLARYFADGATYVDEHLRMHDPNLGGRNGADYYYVPREL